MSEFFRAGGVGMYPVLLFGSLAVAAAVSWALRLERRHLRPALAGLSLELAELYQLRSSGLSYEEMASVLAVPLGTVKSRMHAMVHRLRRELQHDL